MLLRRLPHRDLQLLPLRRHPLLQIEATLVENLVERRGEGLRDAGHGHVLQQFLGDALEETGARIAGFDPGHLEWHGVVDGYLVLYSWSQGEEDIEWWHPLDTGINGRRPLVEA